MGQRMRHYCALMKKNWIVWKRTLAASLCELFCPVALMAILAIARALVTTDIVEERSNIDKTQIFIPADYANTTNSTILMGRINATKSQFGPFYNYSQISFEENLAMLKFLPIGCGKVRTYQERPLIVYAGPESIVDPVVKNIQDTLRWQKLFAEMYISDQRVKAIYETIPKNFTYKRFDSHQAIMDYISSPDYMILDEHPGVCFGFSVTEKLNEQVDTKLIFNGHQQEQDIQAIPSTLFPVADEYSRDQDTESFGKITTQGYAFLQNWIANAILRKYTNLTTASIAMAYIPVKSDKYISDDFGQILTGMLPFFMLLMYILPVYRLISNIVSEKESKARESMKMMGLSDFSYWLSWWTYYFIVVTLISIICLIILAPTVFVYSNKGLIFLYFWVYGLSLFGLCVLIQSFFSRARVAAITGTLIYFGTSFINTAVSDANVSAGAKTLASLLSTVAVSLGSSNLSLFETNGMGLNMENVNDIYNNYRFSACLIMMTISLIISFWLGIYFDNVLPSAYGLRKPWYFCCSPSYWFSSNDEDRTRIHQRDSKADIQEDNEALFETKNMKKENFEPVSRELQTQEKDKKILKIQDLKKTFDNGFQAVKGLNIKMYNGQIFALLGHNGAGKTTTISMLTGLISPSAGHCEVFGKDLFHEMSDVRHFLGVCPQHDILFDLLTPEEHLDIFCDFKGVDKKVKKEEIRKMLVDVDVVAGKDTIAKNLSGGNRRKLSVAIALIGGSKLVLLDEPTAGMDLSARRKLWNMLKNYKNNRIIILTTHYMDEADILGDRIGIMTGGQLICLGSSLFLKNRFGVGYNLTMVKKTKETNNKVGEYLQQHIGEVKKLSEVSSEITYQIPTALSYKFKDFFQRFDNDLDGLDIRSYGVSVTTLEEVFLRVAEGDDTDENIKAKTKLKHQQTAKDQLNDDYSIAEKHETGVINNFFIHIGALFMKRFYLYRRNYKGLIVEVLIPVILVLIGLGFSKVRFFFNPPERELTPNEFPLRQRISVNSNLLRTSSSNIQPSILIGNLPLYDSAFEVTYKDYSGIDVAKYGEQSVLKKFDDDVFQSRLVEPYTPYRYGSYFIYEASNSTKQFKVSTIMNLTSQEVSAFYPQFMYESILKSAIGNKNFKFNVVTTPFPITENLRQRAASANGIFIVFVVSIGFALIPAAVISFIVQEREKNLKHMQLISGMSLPAYWISNMAFDIVKSIIPCAIVIGLMYAFDLGYDYVWILFLLFPIGVIPFTYVTSFIFESENIAQTVTIFLHFVIAGIGAIVASILRFIESTYEVGDALVWVFKIVPSYCLTDSIMYQSIKAIYFVRRPELKVDDLDVKAIGGDILIICMHFIFWLLVLILIEIGAFNCLRTVFDKCKKNQIKPKEDLILDEDVIEEERRVATAKPDQMKVRVHKFRKAYTSAFGKPYLAVEKTSFGLDFGECFALLGVNGAGKTTTFKSLTNEILPTSGEISINGLDIRKNFSEIRKLIGYCPQHDCIFDLMTVEEHLNYYARIKGIVKEKRKELIEKEIKEMNLEEHRKKPAGTLSGGNKRKLSVAMCVLGNPPIILLDEPSAGMDPEARRFMWSVVAKISQQRKKSAVILTTHSMEEAEALSTKMGIMVKGGVFRCFGSSQHIKNKFGTGYEIEVKVRKQTPQEHEQMMFAYDQANSNHLRFEDLPHIMRNKMVDEHLINELRIGGFGNDLVKEAEEYHGKVSLKNFVNWIYVEQNGIKIIEGLVEEFGTIEVLEHYNDYYKFRVPRGDKSIGFVFSLIENKKAEFNISEYSASQTTLEQIFQTFANLNIDDKGAHKFAKHNGRLALIHDDLNASSGNMLVETKGKNKKGNEMDQF